MNPKTALARFAGSNFAWRLLGRPLQCLADLFVRARVVAVKRSVVNATGGRVAEGPFAGLNYPGLTAFGSALYPKLLGVYEKELHPVIEELGRQRFDVIADLGCAEGYYAIGFARMFPQARVVGFDISEEAQVLCTGMARHNGVAERVEVRGRAASNWTDALVASGRLLVFCDCEGAERELFTPENVGALGSAHLVVEIHNTLDHVVSVFARTHEMRIIATTDDDFKAVTNQAALLASEATCVRRALVAENRHWTMAWVYLRPKNAEPVANETKADVNLILRSFLH